MSLSHIAPYVRVSEDKLKDKYSKYPIEPAVREQLVENDLKAEIKDAVQTFNYQLSTLNSTNGQTPFLSLVMYISENTEYEKETAMLIEEFLKQRLEGMENENGVKSTQTFPKLLYFLDENNTYEGSEYFWLTQLVVKCTAKRMNPDYLSVKQLKKYKEGNVVPPMGCRAMLSPFKDEEGNYKLYGRGNLGVQTLNLPFIALEAERDGKNFFEVLDKYLGYCKELGQLRYVKMKGVKARVAPILWQHGAIARLNPDDDVIKAIDDNGFTVTLGYSGIYETIKVLTGKSHTTEEGFELAKKIMIYLEDATKKWKSEDPKMRWALYGRR